MSRTQIDDLPNVGYCRWTYSETGMIWTAKGNCQDSNKGCVATPGIDGPQLSNDALNALIDEINGNSSQYPHQNKPVNKQYIDLPCRPITPDDLDPLPAGEECDPPEVN